MANETNPTTAPDSTSQKLWEILVPTVRNSNDEGEVSPYRTRYHRVWDQKVKAIAGGLTVLTPVRGTWVSDDDETFHERMIPVRIMCTEAEILEIAHMTKSYYDQLAVMVYMISSDVRIID